MDWLTEIGFLYWHWLSLGLLLMAFEMLVPGASMLWMGTAAMVTGIVVWLFPGMEWQWQVIMFGLLGIAAVTGSRRVFKPRPDDETADPPLNRRGAQLIGRITVLEAAIENGQGRARIGDSSWIVTGPDLPAGAKVRITAADGATLQVEQAV